MTQAVSIVGTGNKTVDELVKKRVGLIAAQQENVKSRAALVLKFEAEEDAAKKKRLETVIVGIDNDIAEIERKLANVGIREATDEEKRAALQAITNMDQRRRVAPSYLQPGKAFVLVPVEKTADGVDTVVDTDAPKAKKIKKAKKEA